MTKGNIEYIIRRFPFIIKAINENSGQAVFYVGNRKEVVDLTPEVKSVCNIIETVHQKENDYWIKFIIKLIMEGFTDVNIIHKVPYSRTGYYTKKEAIIEKVYNCCIAWNLVSFDEILMERIA